MRTRTALAFVVATCGASALLYACGGDDVLFNAPGDGGVDAAADSNQPPPGDAHSDTTPGMEAGVDAGHDSCKQ